MGFGKALGSLFSMLHIKLKVCYTQVRLCEVRLRVIHTGGKLSMRHFLSFGGVYGRV